MRGPFIGLGPLENGLERSGPRFQARYLGFAYLGMETGKAFRKKHGLDIRLKLNE